jgi:hypothetical protein
MNENLVNCIIAGTIKAIGVDRKTQFGKLRSIQVEKTNSQGLFDTVIVTDLEEENKYHVGDDVEFKVKVGAELFGKVARPKYTIIRNGNQE